MKTVTLDTSYLSTDVSHRFVAVRVEIDKEEFDRLLEGYQIMWSQLLPGDECGPLNLVRNILKEAERGCVT